MDPAPRPRAKKGGETQEIEHLNLVDHTDTYLYACRGTFDDINWQALTQCVQRVLIRLLVCSEAREAHLDRLKQDELAFHETAAEEAERLLEKGPFSSQHEVLDYFRIIRDFDALEYLAIQSSKASLTCWTEVLASSQFEFRPGDRDDMAAKRLYELAKLCPAVGD